MALLFAGLYFGFDTKTNKQHATEQSRSVQGEATSFETLLADAKEHLSADQANQLGFLEQKVGQAHGNVEKAAALKELSGFWYKFGNVPVAGGYAEQVAEAENTDEAWSVAGGTYFNGIMAAGDNNQIRAYCGGRAVKAFESAASLNPSKVEHRVNLALVYSEVPPPDNPMQAVLMLRDLESKNPQSPSVYNALGRLAIKTNQWDRAVERLEKAWSLDPTNPNTPCLLARAYEGQGNTQKAKEFAEKCK